MKLMKKKHDVKLWLYLLPEYDKKNSIKYSTVNF